jgi:hypothetical protein
MQSGFVNLMRMLSAPETHVLSVNVPREVKVGLITKPNVFHSVRVLLHVITEFLRRPCPVFLGTQLSETGSCMDACVDRLLHAVQGDTSFSAAICRTDFRVGDKATLSRMVPTVSGVRTRRLLPSLYSCLSHSQLR